MFSVLRAQHALSSLNYISRGMKLLTRGAAEENLYNKKQERKQLLRLKDTLRAKDLCFDEMLRKRNRIQRREKKIDEKLEKNARDLEILSKMIK